MFKLNYEVLWNWKKVFTHGAIIALAGPNSNSALFNQFRNCWFNWFPISQNIHLHNEKWLCRRRVGRWPNLNRCTSFQHVSLFASAFFFIFFWVNELSRCKCYYPLLSRSFAFVVDNYGWELSKCLLSSIHYGTDYGLYLNRYFSFWKNEKT